MLRTHNGVKPVFVSVGNNISLDTAVKITLDMIDEESRIPIPTRLADLETHKMRAVLSGDQSDVFKICSILMSSKNIKTLSRFIPLISSLLLAYIPRVLSATELSSSNLTVTFCSLYYFNFFIFTQSS